jgi:glycosyltransferase involved in cell wall biosynthesis
MSNPCIVFIQKRAHKAGAQTCLARLLRHDRIKALNPVLIISEKGWLTRECDRLGVPFIEKAFPSSRSLASRLYNNRAFTDWAAKRLRSLGYEPKIIQANDHLEGLLGLLVAKVTGARSAVFLRSPGMVGRDYLKYRCGEYDLISAVGDELARRAAGWEKNKDILLIHDGLYASEIFTPKEKAAHFPDRVLIIGSDIDWKGWADLTEALYILSMKRRMPLLKVDFTGRAPDPKKNDLKLGRIEKYADCNFLGRVEDFRGTVLSYDLVINPSRHESFGMAAMETLAAGVPLLTSRTGVIGQVLDLEHMLFRPHDPEDLARALLNLMDNWERLDMGLAGCQNKILEKFNIDTTVDKLTEAYGALLNE